MITIISSFFTLVNLSRESEALVTRSSHPRAIPRPILPKSAFQANPSESAFQRNAGLFMSSIEQDEQDSYSLVETVKANSEKLLSDIAESLPSPPEDPLAISGDVAAIGVYCFLDHFVNDLLENVIETPQSLAETSTVVADDGTMVISQAINTMMGTDPGISNTAGGVPGMSSVFGANFFNFNFLIFFQMLHTVKFVLTCNDLFFYFHGLSNSLVRDPSHSSIWHNSSKFSLTLGTPRELCTSHIHTGYVICVDFVGLVVLWILYRSISLQ